MRRYQRTPSEKLANVIPKIMQRFIYLFLLCTIQLSNIFSQENSRGVRLLSSNDSTSGTVRAIIIGVSAYKNLPVQQQLAYAADDAIAFYDFLKSRKDVLVENIKTYYNEEANSYSIKADLYTTLLKESQPDDIVMFYFAGHGDVDANIDDGFLLMYNVCDDGDYFISDALQVGEIQNIVSKAAEKGVKVLNQ